MSQLRVLIMKHRTFNKWYAKLGGYFWIPCPICEQMFGGHESKANYSIPRAQYTDNKLQISRYSGRLVCPDCGKSALIQIGSEFASEIVYVIEENQGCAVWVTHKLDESEPEVWWSKSPK